MQRAVLLVMCVACGGKSAPVPAAKAAPVPVIQASASGPAATPTPAPAPAPAAPSWLGIGPDPRTTRVIQVVRGAPADRAGVQVGDEIVSIAGDPMHDGKDIVNRTRGLPAGKPVALVVRRGGTELKLSAVPEARPVHPEQALVGKPAPAFKLQGAELAQMTGHVVLLEFWATWCGPCEITAPRLDEWQHKFPQMRVVGITGEEAAAVKQFVYEHKIGYTMALDPGELVARQYMVQALPTLVLIDKAGIVREVHVGIPDLDALEAHIQQLM